MELSHRGIALATAALRLAAANRAARGTPLPAARPAARRPERRPTARRGKATTKG
jgi:hypothetical protein